MNDQNEKLSALEARLSIYLAVDWVELYALAGNRDNAERELKACQSLVTRVQIIERKEQA
ncbi:MAG: hypothetical protein KKD77_23220 [Gammaproteobacteria bacterium]|nr:hypothetical protein [Gammaproteobacteria bacterium]